MDRKAVDPGKGPLGEKSSTITDGATKTVLISEKATNPKWPDYTGAVWVGVLFVTGSAVVAWAAFGDVNLDGQVNPTDISLINQGGKFGKGTSTGSVWFQGDFNYSGGVTTTDTSLIGQANLYAKGSYLPVANQGAGFGGEIGTIGSLGSQSLSALGGTALVIGVPEPGTWALAVAGLLLAPALAATRRRAPRTGPPALTGLDGGAGGK